MKGRHLFFLVLLSIYGCAPAQQEGRIEDLKGQLAGLQETQARLETRVEELHNRVFVLEDRIEANRKALQDLKKMALPAEPPDGLEVVKVRPQPEDPESLYEKGYNLFRAGKMEDARDTFGIFLKDFRDHPLADNAQYWIGESYYTERDYERALLAFQKVIDDYPYGNKVPDAMLKVALTLNELGRIKEARKILKRLIKTYPSSEAAMIGKEQLQRLR